MRTIRELEGEIAELGNVWTEEGDYRDTPVFAVTPHGTYTFEIMGVQGDQDTPVGRFIVLELRETAASHVRGCSACIPESEIPPMPSDWSSDIEIEAISTMAQALLPLDMDTQARALRYLLDRFQPTGLGR
jgi:hypothetical protein